MRINQFIAQHTSLSRRAADAAIDECRVTVDGQLAKPGDQVSSKKLVALDGAIVDARPIKNQTIMLNKPTSYVCSRNGQGSKTIYQLLPQELQHLQPVGRLDKDSSGLLLLTNDGELANQLTHPRYQKQKVYQVILSKPLNLIDQRSLEQGIELDDGISKLMINPSKDSKQVQVTMSEGRNRQIRRTFDCPRLRGH